MRRPLVTCALLGLATAAGGCGGDDAASSPADAVRAYNGAVAGGDGERACQLLDEQARRELQRSTQGAARSSCREVIELLGAFYDEATKDRLRNAKVAASQQGDRGRARFISPVGSGGPEREQTYELRRRDGEWRITSLGLTADEPGIAAP